MFRTDDGHSDVTFCASSRTPVTSVKSRAGKPHKTMWVTDLDYVKKERDRCLELLNKKSQKRQQETTCPERKQVYPLRTSLAQPLCLMFVARGKCKTPTSVFHPRVGEVPHGPNLKRCQPCFR